MAEPSTLPEYDFDRDRPYHWPLLAAEASDMLQGKSSEVPCLFQFESGATLSLSRLGRSLSSEANERIGCEGPPRELRSSLSAPG